MTTLMTSLAEIRNFNPCAAGWKAVLAGRKCTEPSQAAYAITFPLVETLEYCKLSDVLWLLGKRKVEISIAAACARKCADSVAHFKHSDDYACAAYADYAYACAAAADACADACACAAAADYAADACACAAYADYANAACANAAADACACAAAADYANADAANAQQTLNKSFLIACIADYENMA